MAISNVSAAMTKANFSFALDNRIILQLTLQNAPLYGQNNQQ
jgi:hypothetical protein